MRNTCFSTRNKMGKTGAGTLKDWRAKSKWPDQLWPEPRRFTKFGQHQVWPCQLWPGWAKAKFSHCPK